MRYNRRNSIEWWMCFFIMLFIFSPILSTQADAHPGALYVLSIAVPTFVLAIAGGYIKNSVINIYAILLFVFACLSTLLSDLGGFGMGPLMKFLVFILLFISTSSFVMPPKQLEVSYRLYLLLSITLSFLIILSFLGGFPHIEATGSQGRYSIGITGFFKNPNYLTSFYNISFFVICYILASVKLSLKKKLILFSLLLFFMVSSFLSGTRAALLVEGLVVLSMPLVLAKKRQLYKFIPIVVVATVVAVVYYEEIELVLNLFLGNRDAFSDESRSDAWSRAFKYIANNPILGCGHNSWSNISQGTGSLEYLHNIFLELVLDQGIVGLLLIIGIITTGYKKTNVKDRLFIKLLLIFSAIPMFFQNGLYEVNFWRFITINRLMMNVSTSYDGGINAFLESVFGSESRENKKQSKCVSSQSAEGDLTIGLTV